MQSSDGRRRFHVLVHGRYTLNDDLSDVRTLTDGGSTTIRDWTNLVPHTIEVTSERGVLTRSYWVAGASRPWDDEAKRRLAEILPLLARDSVR